MVWPQHWFVKFSNLLPHSGWIANPNLPLFSPTCHLFIHRGLDHLGLETVRGTWVISSALSPSSVYSHIVSFHRNWPSMKEGTCNSCNMTRGIVWSDPVHTRSSWSSSPTNACQWARWAGLGVDLAVLGALRGWAWCWARWAGLGVDLAVLGALRGVGRGVGRAGLGWAWIWLCWARCVVGRGVGRAGLGWAWIWLCWARCVGLGVVLGALGWVGRGVWPCWARWRGVGRGVWPCWARWAGLGVGFGRAGRAGLGWAWGLAVLGALGWVGRGVWPCWARWRGCWAWSLAVLGALGWAWGLAVLGAVGWVGRGRGRAGRGGLGWARWAGLGVGFGRAVGWAWEWAWHGLRTWQCYVKIYGMFLRCCAACARFGLGFGRAGRAGLGLTRRSKASLKLCFKKEEIINARKYVLLGALAGLGVVLGVGFGRAGRAGWVGRGVGRGVWAR